MSSYWVALGIGADMHIKPTIGELLAAIGDKITIDNIKNISILQVGIDDYKTHSFKFTDDGKNLHSSTGPIQFLSTPYIHHKLFPPVTPAAPDAPDAPVYLLIKDGIPEEKTLNVIIEEMKKTNINDLKKSVIYDVTNKISYTFSDEEKKFKSKCDKFLPIDLAQYLTVKYKMMIVSAENPSNPFELSYKYVCEDVVDIIENGEIKEMDNYCKSQVTKGKFSLYRVFTGFLVRIYIIKNNIIIGEITSEGIYHKNKQLMTPDTEYSTTYSICMGAIGKYYDTVNEFRKRPIEEILKIFRQKQEIGGILKSADYEINHVTKNADEMINYILKFNELMMTYHGMYCK